MKVSIITASANVETIFFIVFGPVSALPNVELSESSAPTIDIRY